MKIIFNKICCDMFIGINADEYLKKQRVLINLTIELTTPLQKIINNKKELHHFFNYNDVYEAVQTITQAQHWDLQEELINALFHAIFTLSECIHQVTIFTEKTEAYPNCQGVGIEITKTRDEYLMMVQ